ncbi:hypothetical protein [Spirobacillus cienkowskii]|uniref:hypothetical protein n=1 Tax=Spirobacillus cienkowskii TaxID=495820 RepID=UPI0030D3FF60
MFNTKSIFAVVAFSALTISCSNSGGGGDKNNSEKFHNRNNFDSTSHSPMTACNKDAPFAKCFEGQNPSQLEPNKLIKSCPAGTIQINDICDTLKVEFNYSKNSAEKESKIVKLKGKKTDELIVQKEESNGEKKYDYGKYFSHDNNDDLIYNYNNKFWEYESFKSHNKPVELYSKLNIRRVSFSANLSTSDNKLNIDFDFDGYQFNSQNVDLEKVCKELSEKYQTQHQYIDILMYGSDSVDCIIQSLDLSIQGYKNQSGTGSIIKKVDF